MEYIKSLNIFLFQLLWMQGKKEESDIEWSAFIPNQKYHEFHATQTQRILLASQELNRMFCY